MIKEKGWNIIMNTNEIMPKLKDFLCENLGIDADVLIHSFSEMVKSDLIQSIRLKSLLMLMMNSVFR